MEVGQCWGLVTITIGLSPTLSAPEVMLPRLCTKPTRLSAAQHSAYIYPMVTCDSSCRCRTVHGRRRHHTPKSHPPTDPNPAEMMAPHPHCAAVQPQSRAHKHMT